VRVHRQRLPDLAAPQDLHQPLAALHDPVFAQQVRRDDRAGVEPQTERIEVHHFVLYAERVVKSPFGHAPVQRHLAAFEPALELETGPRLGAFVPAPRGLAVARPLSAADPLLGVLHALGRAESVQWHRYSTVTR
jgi:hypothetical protein